MGKYREWVLSWQRFQDTMIWVVHGDVSSEQAESIEVIERAAYEKAIEELEVIADNDSTFPAHVIAKSALKELGHLPK